MPAELEVCLDPEQLYHAWGRGTNECRPPFTGDIYELDDARRVMIAEHPCSMRAGPTLSTSVLVAPVEQCEWKPEQYWQAKDYRRFPLPGAEGLGGFSAARLDHLERCDSVHLGTEGRVACLSLYGANLFQQRLVWYMTRFSISTMQLRSAFGQFYEEVDLLEDWLETAGKAGVHGGSATEAADKALNEEVDGQRLRDLLADEQRRPFVRRRMRQRAREQYGELL